MFRVALDALGTDRAPEPEVQGALQAVQAFPDLEVLLVGHREVVGPHLKGTHHPRIHLIHAEQRVEMTDKPSVALKSKPRSSIAEGLRLLKEGQAHAFVSAGNTGAVMAFSLFVLGRVKGIKRPAIGAFFPTTQRPALVLDVGANAVVKPLHLYQFAWMGSLFYAHMFGEDRPRVGLLSIGEEATKGNETVIEARKLMEQDTDLNFVGFVEGNDVLFARADVVVTDGFTGNVMLKFGEGVVSFIARLVRAEIKRDPLALAGALLVKGALNRVKKHIDYEEYGGSPLMGVNGVVMIAHGRSSARAIMNALKHARHLAEERVVELVGEQIRRSAGEEGVTT